jgi:2,4-dienoyl-CoA reductase-like NADH-dependent reductase (Old Yellow Enzyme family)
MVIRNPGIWCIREAELWEARGRISPADTGMYLASHVDTWRPIAEFVRKQGAVAGMQLAHAGRKGSTTPPWLGGKKVPPEEGGWEPVGPSTEPFDKDYPMPRALTAREVHEIVDAFRKAAERAFAAGFEVLEIHSAHGYLLHEFLSPLSNFRQDEFGGSFENRIRIVLQVAEAARQIWPARLPLFVRVSATDWKEGGWDLEQTIELSKRLKALGVDLIDVSSGGVVPGVQIPVGPGYQVKFAEEIRNKAGIATGAVGMITEPEQADGILKAGQADLVIMARELLRDPYWPRRAAQALGEKIKPPVQYERAW